MNIIISLLGLLIFSILLNLVERSFTRRKELKLKNQQGNNTANEIKLSKRDIRIINAIQQMDIEKQPKLINYDMEKDFKFLEETIIRKCESFKKLDLPDFFIDGNSFLTDKEFEKITVAITKDVIDTLSMNYKAKLYYYVDEKVFNSFVYEKVYCNFLDDINRIHSQRIA